MPHVSPTLRDMGKLNLANVHLAFPEWRSPHPQEVPSMSPSGLVRIFLIPKHIPSP